MTDALVEVKALRKLFPVRGGLFSRTIAEVKAVDGISFSIPRGETLGLVGESGCGKTTVGRTILRLAEPTSGQIVFDGRDITRIKGGELRALRREMQIVFQDPQSSLNPRMTVKQILQEPLIHTIGMPHEKVRPRVLELLARVGLNPDHANRFPHEFSGGQRQRIGIARALATEPKFIVLDEPTSALDVSVQAQVLNLLKDLQREYGLTYLFISHDLSVVRHMATRVAVMYLGEIVEHGPVHEIFADPQHPYTQALFSAVPIPDPDTKMKRIILSGDVPSPVSPPAGCRFHPRCARAKPDCSGSGRGLADDLAARSKELSARDREAFEKAWGTAAERRATYLGLTVAPKGAPPDPVRMRADLRELAATDPALARARLLPADDGLLVTFEPPLEEKMPDQFAACFYAGPPSEAEIAGRGKRAAPPAGKRD